ncbi:MAG: hypothetical protein ABIE74_03515 [Pseudomonadota bacterium]
MGKPVNKSTTRQANTTSKPSLGNLKPRTKNSSKRTAPKPTKKEDTYKKAIQTINNVANRRRPGRQFLVPHTKGTPTTKRSKRKQRTLGNNPTSHPSFFGSKNFYQLNADSRWSFSNLTNKKTGKSKVLLGLIPNAKIIGAFNEAVANFHANIGTAHFHNNFRKAFVIALNIHSVGGYLPKIKLMQTLRKRAISELRNIEKARENHDKLMQGPTRLLDSIPTSTKNRKLPLTIDFGKKIQKATDKIQQFTIILIELKSLRSASIHAAYSLTVKSIGLALPLYRVLTGKTKLKIPKNQHQRTSGADLLALMADQLSARGAMKAASNLFNRASQYETRTYQKYLYKLIAAQNEIAYSKPSQARKITSKIEKIRTQLTKLTKVLLMHKMLNGEAGEKITDITEKQLDMLFLYSSSALFSARLLGLGTRGSDESDVKMKLAYLRDSLLQFRHNIKARLTSTEKLSSTEASLYLNYMLRVASICTRKSGGLISFTRAIKNQKEAEKFHKELVSDFKNLKKLIAHLYKNKSGNPIRERLAKVAFDIYFHGNLSLDYPLDALKQLKKIVLPEFAGSKIIRSQLKSLKATSGWLFNKDGSIVDLNKLDRSRLDSTKLAADRTLSAYAFSNSNLREFGTPMLAGAACAGVVYGAAAILAPESGGISLFAAASLGSAICGAGAVGLNYLYNTRVLAVKQYQQTLRTGLTNYTAAQADKNWGKFYLLSGINVGFTALGGPGLGNLARGSATGALKFIGGGIANLAKSTVTYYADMGSIRAGTLGLLKGALKGTFNAGVGATAGLGKWYWKKALFTKAMIATSALYPIDKYIINRNGQTGLLGHIGKTAFWTMLLYHSFSRTWSNPELVAKAVAEKGLIGKFVSLVEQIENSLIHRSIIQGGAAILVGDLFLYNKDPKNGYGLKLVNFDMPQNTDLQRKIYENQFKIDTWLGYLGGGAFLGKWIATDALGKNLALFNLNAWWTRARIATGASAVGMDIAWDGKLNHWAGGLGGAFLMNEACGILLNVDPGGSLVATFLKAIVEWALQIQQGVEPTLPDPKRLMLSSAESAIMRVPAKWMMLGANQYLMKFPAGIKITNFLGKYNNPVKHPTISRLISSFPAITNIGGRPYVRSGDSAMKFDAIGKNGKVTLSDGTEITIIKQPGRFSKQPTQNGQIQWGADGKVVKFSQLTTEQIKALEGNGITFNARGQLSRPVVVYENSKVFGGKKMTADEVMRLPEGERKFIISQLGSRQIFIKGETGSYYYARAELKMPDKAVIITGKPDKILNMKRHRLPDSDKWIYINRSYTRMDGALRVGGRTMITFTGSPRKPRMTFPIVMLNGVIIGGSAYLVNKLIFQKAMTGDPTYQPLQRLCNYALSQTVIDPYIQWPMGFDGWKPQLIGRLVGLIGNLGGNGFFPTYIQTMPAQRAVYRELQSKRPNPIAAIDKWGRAVTSWQVDPVFKFWGESVGSNYYFENKAIRTFRLIDRCRRDVLSSLDPKAELNNSQACKAMPPKTLEKVKTDLSLNSERLLARSVMIKNYTRLVRNLARGMRSLLHTELNRDLSPLRRRTLILMALHMTQVVHSYRMRHEYKYKFMLKLMKPWIKLMTKERYQPLFSKLPQRVLSPEEWKCFIDKVNKNMSEASGFYKKLRNHRNNEVSTKLKSSQGAKKISRRSKINNTTSTASNFKINLDYTRYLQMPSLSPFGENLFLNGLHFNPPSLPRKTTGNGQIKHDNFALQNIPTGLGLLKRFLGKLQPGYISPFKASLMLGTLPNQRNSAQ